MTLFLGLNFLNHKQIHTKTLRPALHLENATLFSVEFLITIKDSNFSLLLFLGKLSYSLPFPIWLQINYLYFLNLNNPYIFTVWNLFYVYWKEFTLPHNRYLVLVKLSCSIGLLYIYFSAGPVHHWTILPVYLFVCLFICTGDWTQGHMATESHHQPYFVFF